MRSFIVRFVLVAVAIAIAWANHHNASSAPVEVNESICEAQGANPDQACTQYWIAHPQFDVGSHN